MLGIVYLLLCVLTGREVTELFLLRRVREASGNRFWLLFPMAFGSGTLVLTWILYGLSYLAEVWGNARHPLFLGNVLTMGTAALFLAAAGYRRRKSGKKVIRKNWINDQILFRKEVLFFGALFLFLSAIMFFVFIEKNNCLYAGFTVFSDYAPHTAMIRSFSFGNNFPTQYPHFGGTDVKYHFMFQFLTGNLEYLGLRIDLAYNLVSILSLWSFLMMLYKLTGRVMGRFLTGVLTVFIFFFRSGFTFFRFLWEHIRMGDLWQVLKENTAFIGYTQNENWGLWCFNVYLNQRHLAYGLLIVCLVLWVFFDWLEDGDNHPEKGVLWAKNRLFSAVAWKSRDVSTAILMGILLGLCAFWNGAAVIGGLLMLAGFALFSDGKLDYLIMAAVTICLSALQSWFFMDGSAVDFSFYWGLLSDDKSFSGVLHFVLLVTGIYFLGLAVVAVFTKRLQRAVMAAFFAPLLFAFTISLTPDIAVNHKYVMISHAFLGMFWAWTLVEFWRRKKGLRLAAVFLAIILMGTGIYDFVIILRDNDRNHRISIQMDHPVTEWLKENLDSHALVLTPEYSISEVTMSGLMMYNGWPYYAWSAGYDTNRRAQIALEIYTSSSPERVQELVEEEGITHILFEEGMCYEDEICSEETISGLFSLIYESEDGGIRIYEVG